jgi:hypothetical protein
MSAADASKNSTIRILPELNFNRERRSSRRSISGRRKVAALVNEEIEDEDMDAGYFAAIIVEQIEFWKAGLIESDDFAIYDGFFRKLAEGFDDERRLTVERTIAASQQSRATI